LARLSRLRTDVADVGPTGSGWCISALPYLDWQWSQPGRGLLGHEPSGREMIPDMPSDYFRRQFHLGSSVLTVPEIQRRHEIGVEQMMFGTDFPHFESTWSTTKDYLRTLFGCNAVPEDEMRAILGENALRCYGLDRAALEQVAQRCGPTAEELLTPPDAGPLDHWWITKLIFLF
jgi:Amidohydrolase